MPAEGRIELAGREAEPFPALVEKVTDYGAVDPVMIGADIYGWARSVVNGSRLSAQDRERLHRAAD